MYSGSWWNHKNAYDSASSWRPYCRKKWKFIATPQLRSQINSYASSCENSCYENSGSESNSGTRNGKIGENFGYSSFFIINGHMSYEKWWIGNKAPKIQRLSGTPRWYYKRRFRVSCNIHWTKIINITNDNRGYHIQTAGLCKTSSWCSISVYQEKWRMHPNYCKFQNRNAQTFGFVYHDTKSVTYSGQIPLWPIIIST